MDRGGNYGGGGNFRGEYRSSETRVCVFVYLYSSQFKHEFLITVRFAGGYGGGRGGYGGDGYDGYGDGEHLKRALGFG